MAEKQREKDRRKNSGFIFNGRVEFYFGNG